MKEYSAGCYLIKKDGDSYKLCIINRNYSDVPNAYVLPKGHVDPGESRETAAIREVGEEAGYRDIKILKSLGEDNYKVGKDVEKTVYWFLAELNNPNEVSQTNFTPEERENFIELLWVDFDRAAQLLTFVKEESRKRIEDIKNYLKEQN